MADKLTLLEELIGPIAESFGCELWGLHFNVQQKKSMLTIFIDKLPDGVSIEDCERVSRQVASVLDVEDIIPGEYVLEVSSPGMDRKLFKLNQYQRFVGHKVSIRLRVSFEGRKKFSGLLKGVEDEDVVVEVDNEEYLLPFELIDKANIVPTF